METGIIFKIRNKETGLFSTGSRNGRVSWTKNGKAWSSIGHVKSSIAQFTGNKYRNYPYDNAELVTYKTEIMDSLDINEFIGR